jgi:hypothetical protein
MRKTERISYKRTSSEKESGRDSENTSKARKDQIVTLTIFIKETFNFSVMKISTVLQYQKQIDKERINP